MASLKNTTINDTGYLKLPSGTTAQRPSSPSVGYMRWNTTNEATEIWNGSAWVEGPTATPPPPPFPFVTNGLQQYLDASDSTSYPGSGSTWYDVSGNNRNVTGLTSFTSAGTASYFNIDSLEGTGPASNSFGINNTSGYTIILVFKTNTITANAAFKFWGNVGYNRGIFLHPGWVNNTLYWDQGGCCDANQRLTASMTYSTWQMLGLRSDVSSRKIFLNSAVVASSSTAAANINLDSRAQTIGGPSDEADWPGGDLALFAVYNRGISDAEWTSNYNGIKSRFGI
jgi:hypothetical protein